MWSLQRRVILTGLAWAFVATLFGAFVLTKAFDQIANQRFNQDLRDRHVQLIAALGNAFSQEDLEGLLTDAVYERVYSGTYWQATNEDGDLYTSPSLFDSNLPQEQVPDSGVAYWEGTGPSGAVRGIHEKIALNDGSIWTVTVAKDLASLVAERAVMQKSSASVLGFVALIGIAGAALLASALVAPIGKLGSDVKHRWDSGDTLEPGNYPSEIRPLVTDINDLMALNRDVVARGRRQAADLAHALKTPSAVLRNHLIELSRKVDGVAPLLDALDKIDAQVSRSLGRMRAATAENAANVKTDTQTSVARMERLFRSLPEAQRVSFEIDSQAARLAVDAPDFEEILGNILENAFKWARQHVRLSVHSESAVVCITIEDDGPGIEPALLPVVLQEGKRLDTSVPGTGLGLSIAEDLAKAYGGKLELVRSETLGGLMCRIILPGARPGVERVTSKIA